MCDSGGQHAASTLQNSCILLARGAELSAGAT